MEEEAEARQEVEVTPVTAGVEVEAEVTHIADQEADHTLILPTILEATLDRSHFTRDREVDPTTPPTPQGQGPGQGLPPSCEEEAPPASWTRGGSRVRENDRCRTTAQPRVHPPPHPQVELRQDRRHRISHTVDRRRGQTVENRIPSIMISPMLNCVISSFKYSNVSSITTRLENCRFSVSTVIELHIPN